MISVPRGYSAISQLIRPARGAMKRTRAVKPSLPVGTGLTSSTAQRPVVLYPEPKSGKPLSYKSETPLDDYAITEEMQQVDKELFDTLLDGKKKLGMNRTWLPNNNGIIKFNNIKYNGKEWLVYKADDITLANDRAKAIHNDKSITLLSPGLKDTFIQYHGKNIDVNDIAAFASNPHYQNREIIVKLSDSHTGKNTVFVRIDGNKRGMRAVNSMGLKINNNFNNKDLTLYSRKFITYGKKQGWLKTGETLEDVAKKQIDRISTTSRKIEDFKPPGNLEKAS